MPSMPNGFIPEVSGYSHGGPAGIARTEVAGGSSRYIRQWDGGAQQFSCSLILDKTQYSVWSAWYHQVIKKGAIAFDMLLDSGLGLQPHNVNIVPGSYTVSAVDGANLRVSFTAEGGSSAYGMTDADVSAFAAAYGLTADALPSDFIPLVSNYSHDGPGGVEFSDGGVSAYALAWDRGLQKFNVTLMLTADQYKMWAVWFHRLIGKGARAFDMMLDSGFGVEPHTANILPGTYSAARSENMTIAAFSVEAESKAYQLTEDEAAGLVGLYNTYSSDFNALLQRLEQFATVDSLALQF